MYYGCGKLDCPQVGIKQFKIHLCTALRKPVLVSRSINFVGIGNSKSISHCIKILLKVVALFYEFGKRRISNPCFDVVSQQ